MVDEVSDGTGAVYAAALGCSCKIVVVEAQEAGRRSAKAEVGGSIAATAAVIVVAGSAGGEGVMMSPLGE